VAAPPRAGRRRRGERSQPSRYLAVRGRVRGIAEAGAAAHIDELSQRYLGRPYPWFGGRDQTRLIMRIEAERITAR
jgi:hypothetical protein